MTAPRASRGSTARALDERAFHRWLAHTLPAGADRPLPLGDDAAALAGPRGTLAVVSTDALLEGTHFLASSAPERIGRAAVAVGLSDVASKGAAPAAVLLALQLPRRTPERWARRLLLAAEAMASASGAHVVGGDTKAGPARAVVSTVIGWARPSRLVPRSGARPGDLLVTTGAVGFGGAASVGLAGSGSERQRAADRMLRIRPRVREGVRLARFARAMLDTSDGLAEAAHLLSSASRVRLDVDERLLPWAPAISRLEPARRRRLGFYGGDYELLAAIPAARMPAARRALVPLGCPLTVVGTVRAGRGAYLRQGTRVVPMPRTTWQPFG